MSRKEAKAQKKKAKKYSESVTDSYDESARIITDEEAHRDVVYELPSAIKQIKECFMIQMKRYTRQKAMWFGAVLLILIPVLFYLFKSVPSIEGMLPDSHITNIYIASLLEFMPVIVPLLACIACGSMLSQEFNERTVYLSLPLPMSRSTFYLGKFLAGLVLIEGVIAAAYGLCIILALTVTDSTYTGKIAESLIMAMSYGFFCCALTYGLSTKLRRGSTMLPLVILFIILPIAGIALAQFGDNETLIKIASYFPCFSMESALLILGDTMPISVWGIAGFMTKLVLVPGKSVGIMAAVSIVFGLIFLYLGDRAVKRRDM